MECFLCKFHEKVNINPATAKIFWNNEIYDVCKDCQREVIQFVDDYTGTPEFDELSLDTTYYEEFF